MKNCILVLALFFISTPAFAGKIMFGLDESFHKIQDVEILGPNGEDLDLSYMLEKRFFVAGLYLKDKGYVLSTSNSEGNYYRLDAAEIVKFQTSGLLPTPMPSYKIDIIEYLIGYSLWLVIFAVIVWGFVEKTLKKKRQSNTEEIA